jgi:crossover junction endodeoxyribonuclease RusA
MQRGGMIIDLPWPPRDLQPNARVHWTRRHRATKAAREWAHWVCHQLGPIEADQINVTLTFFPPDNRRRDIDNMLAASKALIDGVAQSLEVDDSKWAITLRRGDVVKGGNVRFEIEVPAHG